MHTDSWPNQRPEHWHEAHSCGLIEHTLAPYIAVFRVSIRDVGARWTSVPGLGANGRPTQYWQVVIVLFGFCVVCLIDVKNWQAAAMAKWTTNPRYVVQQKVQRTPINKRQRRVRQQYCTIVADQCSSQHSGMGILCASVFRPLLNILAALKLCKLQNTLTAAEVKAYLGETFTANTVKWLYSP